jgi:hypothetical protein
MAILWYALKDVINPNDTNLEAYNDVYPPSIYPSVWQRFAPYVLQLREAATLEVQAILNEGPLSWVPRATHLARISQEDQERALLELSVELRTRIIAVGEITRALRNRRHRDNPALVRTEYMRRLTRLRVGGPAIGPNDELDFTRQAHDVAQLMGNTHARPLQDDGPAEIRATPSPEQHGEHQAGPTVRPAPVRHTPPIARPDGAGDQNDQLVPICMCPCLCGFLYLLFLTPRDAYTQSYTYQ